MANDIFWTFASSIMEPIIRSKAERTSGLTCSSPQFIRQLPTAVEPPIEELKRALPNTAIVRLPCQRRGCCRGAFVPPVDARNYGEHDMNDHCIASSDWDPRYEQPVTGRGKVVASAFDLLLENGVIIIAATPQVGRTTLLRLLARHVLCRCPSLRPISIDWYRQELRNDVGCQLYLQRGEVMLSNVLIFQMQD